MKGYKRPPRSLEWCQKISAAKKGQTLTAEHRQKLSVAGRGRKLAPRTPEHCQRISAAKKGYKLGPPTLEHRQNLSEATKASIARGTHNSYQGGLTSGRAQLQNTFEYKEWRRQIYERDDYTCQICGQHGGNLNADHIKPIRLYPELALDLENGRTLCVGCHRQTDTYGGRMYALLKAQPLMAKAC